MKNTALQVRRATLAWALVALLSFNWVAAAQTISARPANDPALKLLEREMARLAKSAGGTVGVAAIHLETGRHVSLNGTERFPMASTFKVPVAEIARAVHDFFLLHPRAALTAQRDF